MRVGIITGSGTDTWPGLDSPATRTADTRYGKVTLTESKLGEAEIVHIARHEAGHRRLSNQVSHRANLAAMLDASVDCLVSLTVCGAVDPAARPGTVIVFDDLYFPGNRLPDGSLCTWHDTPGAAGRLLRARRRAPVQYPRGGRRLRGTCRHRQQPGRPLRGLR